MLAHVVGARPNFMKAGPVVRGLADFGVEQRVIHTGQHYDDAMSQVFFRELGLPEPDLNLEVGSDTHARQTAALMTALESAFLDLAPELVVVYGDVNSTLAAAVTASKLGIRIAHVEAGLRSFDNTMPEETNRRVTDTLSDFLFVTSPEAIANLAREGATIDAIHFVGNPMIDTLLTHLDRFDPDAIRDRYDLDRDYAVATLHRPHNVDTEGTAAELVKALVGVSERLPVLLPLHPRGRLVLEAVGLSSGPRLQVIEPLGYLDFMSAVRGARFVITDSGGVQEETTILEVPCLTVRPNTERPITITHGTNQLVRISELLRATDDVLGGHYSAPRERPPLWDGHAGKRTARALAQALAPPP